MLRSLYFFTVGMLLSVVTTAQITYTSLDNYSGLWSDANSWTQTGPASPTTPGNPTHGSCDGMNIYGYIRVNGGLTMNNANPHLQVYDTLYVDGDFLGAAGAALTVHPGGLLIVTGSYRSEGGFSATNNGTIVVLGDFTLDHGTTAYTNQQLYIFGTLNNSNGYVGTSSGDRCGTWDGCDPTTYTSTEPDLMADDMPLYNFVMAGGVLPVDLVNFIVERDQKTVVLQWTTLSEINFQYFSVERSTDGEIYHVLDKVEGKGNASSINNYTFYDRNPLPENAYYRLAAVDFDGYIEYFRPVRAVRSGAEINFRLFPNPVQAGKFNISVTEKLTNVQMQKLTGQTVKLTVFSTNLGYQVTFPEHTSSGVYVLRLSFQDKEIYHRVVVP